MNQNKIIQIAAIIVAGVWISCISTIVSVKMIRSRQEPTEIYTTAPTEITTEESTTAPTTTAPRLPIGGNIVTSAPEVGDPEWLINEEESKRTSELAEEIKKSTTTTKPKDIAPKGKAKIIKTYVDAVNALKKAEKFSMYKDDTLEVEIDEITGGAPAQSLVQSLMSKDIHPPESYSFEGGVDAATAMTPNQVIAPLNIAASVEESAVTKAESVANSDGGYTITLTLKDELQTHAVPAPNHLTMVEVVDFEPLLPPGASVTEINITYTGTIIKATFDRKNRLVSMTHYLNVDNANGQGKVALIPVTMKLHGNYTSNYTFSY